MSSPGWQNAAGRGSGRPAGSVIAADGHSSTRLAPTSSTAEGDAMDERIGRSLGTDYFRIADQLSPEEVSYWRRTREFVDDEVLPVINDYWERAEFPWLLIETLAKL